MNSQKDETLEVEDAIIEDQAAEAAAEAAAFEASFSGKKQPAAKQAPVEEKAPEPEPAPEAKAEPLPAIQEAAPKAPSPKTDDVDLRGEMRKLHGKIGALNDQLQTALKAKETDGKPAVLSPVALTRLKAEYPELSDLLEGDITEAIASLAAKKADPKEIEELVARGVAKELHADRHERLLERHENWVKDLWVDQPGGTPTQAYQDWLKTMPEADVHAFNTSESPAFISRKLDNFYEWRVKQTKTQAEKQNRLKAALTPQSESKGSSQTMSEEEAERKAFEDSFNS